MTINQEIYQIAKEIPFESLDLIKVFKQINGLEMYYISKVRHYTLEKHTFLVLQEFEKHFNNCLIPISKSLFRIFLSIHDIGKPLALQNGKLSDQHLFSCKIIKEISEYLPLNKAEIQLCKTLIINDPIGLFFQNKIDINSASTIIRNSSKNTFLSLEEYFKVLTIYYQVDTGSYTLDAGGLTYLEGIFNYENGNKTYDLKRELLQFSSNFEQKYILLEKAII